MPAGRQPGPAAPGWRGPSGGRVRGRQGGSRHTSPRHLHETAAARRGVVRLDWLLVTHLLTSLKGDRNRRVKRLERTSGPFWRNALNSSFAAWAAVRRTAMCAYYRLLTILSSRIEVRASMPSP